MKIIKLNKTKTIVEDIEKTNRVKVKDDIQGVANPVYVDALTSFANTRKLVKDRTKDVEKITLELEKETVDRKENQIPKSQELKKMKLTESLISGIKNKVKEILSDHLVDSFEHNQALVISEDVEEYDPAWCLETASHPVYTKTENSRDAYINSLLDMLFYYAPKDVKEAYAYDYRTAADDLISAIEDGFVDWETVARACLSYMSSDEIYDMCRLNDFSIYNPEEDEELDESREPNKGDVKNAPFAVDADGEQFAFDTKNDMDAWIKRNKASFKKIKIIKQKIKENKKKDNLDEAKTQAETYFDCLWDQLISTLSYSGEGTILNVTPYPYHYLEVKPAMYSEKEGYDVLVVDSPNLQPAKNIVTEFGLEFKVDSKGRLRIFVPENAPVNKEIEQKYREESKNPEIKKSWDKIRAQVKKARKAAGLEDLYQDFDSEEEENLPLAVGEELKKSKEQVLNEKENSSVLDKIKEIGKEKELNALLADLYPNIDEKTTKDIVEQDKHWFYTMLGMEE